MLYWAMLQPAITTTSLPPSAAPATLCCVLPCNRAVPTSRHRYRLLLYLSPLQELQNSILYLKRQLEEAAEDQATLLAVQVRAECHMSPSLQHNTTLLSA